MVLKSFMSKNICVPCILRPLAYLILMNANCKHWNLKPFTEAFEIKNRKFLTICLTSLCVLVFVFGFLFNIHLLTVVCSKNEADCLLVLSNTILTFAGIWITKILLDYLDLWLEKMNKWSRVFDELLKQRSMFPELRDFAKTYTHRTRMSAVFLFLQFVFLTAICVMLTPAGEMFLLAPEIALFVISLTQVGVLILVSIAMMIIKDIIRLSGIYFCKTMQDYENVQQLIVEYGVRVEMATNTWKELNQTMYLPVMMCVICSICLIILNIFAIIIESDANTMENIPISCFRVISIGFVLLYVLTSFDQERMVSVLEGFINIIY